MRRYLLVLAVLPLLGFTAGCSHIPFFGKKKPAYEPTEKISPHISTQLEMDFRGRWVEKRASELAAQGMSPEAAQAQALAEFNQTYPFTNPANGVTK